MSFVCSFVYSFFIAFTCTGLGGASEAGPSTVRGGGQLSVDGGVAMPDDAGLAHPHRPQHAAGGQGKVEGETLPIDTNTKYCVPLPCIE